MISLQALVALVVFIYQPVTAMLCKKTAATGERHLEAREVPAAVVAGRGREERRGAVADKKPRRKWNPL